FASPLPLVGVMVIMLALDVQLALVVFLTFPLLAIASLVFRIVAASAYRITRERIADVTAYLQESLSGIRVVRSFAQEERHVSRMGELNELNRQANMKTVYLNASYFPAVELLSAVGTALILLYGGYQALDLPTEAERLAQIGVVVAFVGYLSTLFDPITQLSNLYTTYQQGMAALDKIFDLLDTEPDMVDRPDAADPGTLRGEIEMDHVWFSYGLDHAAGVKRSSGKIERLDDEPESADWALEDVSIHVPPGETLALVGETGAGKSTFGERVSRFCDPQAGAGPGAGGRPRSARPARELPAQPAGDRPAGGLPVLRERPGEHRLRAPGRERGGDRGGGRRDRRRGLHPPPLRRVRHRGRGAR